MALGFLGSAALTLFLASTPQGTRQNVADFGAIERPPATIGGVVTKSPFRQVRFVDAPAITHASTKTMALFTSNALRRVIGLELRESAGLRAGARPRPRVEFGFGTDDEPLFVQVRFRW